jgi:DNA (cytosine-5)-methyltransferase 1
MLKHKLKVYDMFSGIGGFSLGFLRAGGFKICAQAEIEEYPCEVLRKNFYGVPNFGDVTKIKYSLNQFDVIIGGFPCTDISIAAWNATGGIYGARSILWKEYFRAIAEIRPKYCVIENVHMLLRRGLNTILSDLAKVGYDAAWTTLDAKYCGTAQRRRRVYVLGVRDGITIGADPFEFAGRDTDAHRSKIRLVDQGFEWNFESREKVGQAFAYFTEQRSDEFDTCGVSATLTKRDYKDFTDLVVSAGHIRKITPVERLRLLGFPDNWHIEHARESDKYKYCGMHVPAVEHIADCLRRYDWSLDV